MVWKTLTKSSFVWSKSTVEPYGMAEFVLFYICSRFFSAQETILSNEDEELIANLQENRVSVSYKYCGLKNASSQLFSDGTNARTNQMCRRASWIGEKCVKFVVVDS